MDKETQEKIQELQSYEQNLHSLLMQKQAFQFEINETENALSEVSKSEGDIFRMVGGIIMKADKEKVLEELKHKENILSLRLKSLEKQESEVSEKAEELKEEVLKKIK